MMRREGPQSQGRKAGRILKGHALWRGGWPARGVCSTVKRWPKQCWWVEEQLEGRYLSKGAEKIRGGDSGVVG